MPDAPPRLVYDDDCGFCTWSAEFAAARGEFELVGFSELSPDQLARLPDDYETCAHLLTADAVYSCGKATEMAVERLGPPYSLAVAAFRAVPGSERAREPLYRLVADNRGLLGRLVSR
ncbi:thiol-disulfide oxidoreductase DCC family protein [Halostella litorea]|uniref:thiol-disulfide oxidoreductase DCC family protein n=1 Tax=Halostella litorea TaxID=2528831 RepID=UPI0010928784|nr:DUF393 domain-containing protein [Halostella litorea]